MPDRVSNSPGRSEISERPFFCALTAREVEVLSLRATGLTGGAIALRLAIAETTVKGHLRNVRDKLDAFDTTHAVALAIVWQLIDIELFLRREPREQIGDRGLSLRP
ncbi:MAG TPA: helix-turn-helix transcriptional regulator [Anaerolineae bacterium]|jgi:DNA-binding CsgD family transcriptional regulator